MTQQIAGERAGVTGDRWYAAKLVGLFGIGWTILSADHNLLGPLLPLIRQDFQLSGTQAGLVTAAFYIPYLLMQIPAGMLADRFGPKQVLVVMTLVAAFGIGGIGLFAVSLAGLIIFAMIHRAGAGVYYPSAFGITISSVPQSIRGISSAVLSGGMALGNGLGMAVAVPLATAGGSWRFPFIVLAVATFVLPLAILGIVRSGQRVSAGRGSGLGTAMRDPGIWLLFSLGACTNFGYSAVTTWGPSFLSSERGLSLVVAGFYMALISFIGFPVGFLTGRISDRIGRRRLTAGLFFVSALSIVGLALVRDPLLILLMIALYGVTGKWASDSPIIAWIGDRVTTRYASSAASMFGVNNTFRMVGALFSPLVAGALLDLTGSLQAGLYVGAASLGLAALFALLAEDSRKAEASR